MVSNAWYETYSCKVDARYKAFRLAVAGVEGVVESNNDPPPGANVPPPRVLLDEMFVSEAVNATMGFKNVGCFRKKLAETTERPGVPSSDEQPICQEAWGVQCEIYGAQLASDIAFDITPTVKLHWYEGVEPWGYENWKDRPGANSAQLSRATDTGDDRYVYRSSMSKSPDAVVPMSLTAPTYVQYTLEVVFYTADSNCRCSDFFCDFFAEFFGNVLENHFEASEAIDELCCLFNGACFFFCSAFLLEVFCGLR